MILLQALFLASLGLGLARRNGAILVISLAALLKIGLHAVLVSGARFYLPAIALELVVIPLGIWEAFRSKDPRTPWKALAWGLAASLSLFFLSRPLYSYVRRVDSVPQQRTYRFLLTSWQHPGQLQCLVRQGRLTALGDTEAVLETLNTQPRPGEKGMAECTLTQKAGPPVPLKVEVLDSYAPGGLPGRMVQRIMIDGREAVLHDPAAEPGTGWVAAPAVVVEPGKAHRITIAVEALSPDPGVPWGAAGGARIRISPAP